MNKLCKYCNIEYPIDHYKNGHKCLTCRRKQVRDLARKRRAENPEAALQYGRDYYKLNPDRAAAAHRKYMTGISAEEYAAKLTEQNGVCAACRLPEKVLHKNGKPFSLAVDHDHVTGQVRGLLCMKCNRALGLLNDSAETVMNLLHYRERF